MGERNARLGAREELGDPGPESEWQDAHSRERVVGGAQAGARPQWGHGPHANLGRKWLLFIGK